jgi:N-glycosylase/DNA lyase
MEFNLNLSTIPFNLEHTLDSGQAFRWARSGNWWQGVLPEGAVRVMQEEASLVCVSSSEGLNPKVLRHYFRIDDSLERIYSKIMKDEHVTEAVQRYYGLRLIAQDVWECLVSFAVATNTNIPRIKGMISSLCERFGDESSFEGRPYFGFPTPESLADASVDELVGCGLGYRARFVSSVAKKVSSGAFELEELRLLDYARARDLLIERLPDEKTLLGIGRKAADCVLLFSCGKDSAFPIDVWMARVLSRYYPGFFDKGTLERLDPRAESPRLSGGQYDSVTAAMRGYFGEYAGYAQQYLFHDARKSKLE